MLCHHSLLQFLNPSWCYHFLSQFMNHHDVLTRSRSSWIHHDVLLNHICLRCRLSQMIIRTSWHWIITSCMSWRRRRCRFCRRPVFFWAFHSMVLVVHPAWPSHSSTSLHFLWVCPTAILLLQHENLLGCRLWCVSPLWTWCNPSSSTTSVLLICPHVLPRPLWAKRCPIFLLSSCQRLQSSPWPLLQMVPTLIRIDNVLFSHTESVSIFDRTGSAPPSRQNAATSMETTLYHECSFCTSEHEIHLGSSQCLRPSAVALHDDSDRFCLSMPHTHTLRTTSGMDNVVKLCLHVQLLLLVALHSVPLHVVVVVVEHLLVHLHVVQFLHLLLLLHRHQFPFLLQPPPQSVQTSEPCLSFNHLRLIRNTKILPFRKISTRLLPLCM